MSQGNGLHNGRRAEIERQARLLARDNRIAEPAITRVLWFPDNEEVRLLEVDDTVPSTGDGIIHPFYFRPSPKDALPSPSALALIRPEEFGKAKLPPNWGDWSNAIELETER